MVVKKGDAIMITVFNDFSSQTSTSNLVGVFEGVESVGNRLRLYIKVVNGWNGWVVTNKFAVTKKQFDSARVLSDSEKLVWSV